MNTDQRYEAVLRVRRDGTSVLIDGRVITRTPTNYAGLTTPPVYALPAAGMLGIASWETPTVCQVIEVTEHSGPGTMLP